MKNLKISKEISLPIDLVTQTIAILAKRRVGKSYTTRRISEQLLTAGQQVVIVDPKGDQWGIRSSADGKSAGFPVIILGGEHGDVPLEVHSGEIVAKLVVEERVSILLDLSVFRKHEVATFMTAFMENLYRLKAQEKYRTPVMLIVDEADAIAPQKPQKGEERMLGAAEDIVRRGGQRGLGCILVTQRSAVLNKNVLTQSEMLIVLRTISPQDLSAMRAWIDVHGTIEQGKELMDSLPSLPIGDAWFWSPGWPTGEGIFKRVHILPIETFDSGATPKPGERKVMPKTAADIDLDALKKQMAETIEKAKADDPKILRKRIAELEKSLSTPKNPIVNLKEITKIIEKPILKDSQITKFTSAVEKMGEETARHRDAMNQIIDNLQLISHPIFQAKDRVSMPLIAVSTGKIQKSDLAHIKSGNIIKIPPEFYKEIPENSDEIGRGELAILKAVAQYPEGMTRDHITVMVGYKQSSRDTYIKRLINRGLIESADGLIRATEGGIAMLGDNYSPLPTGAKLRDHLMETLPEGEKRILSILIEAYPSTISRNNLSDHVGYKQSSRDTYLKRLASRKLIQIEGPGLVRASHKLFMNT